MFGPTGPQSIIGPTGLLAFQEPTRLFRADRPRPRTSRAPHQMPPRMSAFQQPISDLSAVQEPITSPIGAAGPVGSWRADRPLFGRQAMLAPRPTDGADLVTSSRPINGRHVPVGCPAADKSPIGYLKADRLLLLQFFHFDIYFSD